MGFLEMIPTLVMRGSKIKPQSLPELYDDAAKIQQEASQEHLELSKAKIAVEEVHGLLAQPESEMEAQALTNRELLRVIENLNARISLLESRAKAADTKVSENYKDLIYTLKQFACGGLAGATARTCVCPIDRVKILMQTQYISFGAGGKKYHSVFQTAKRIWSEEGVTKLWRGNLANITRVVPYSATQFTTYDYIKHKFLTDKSKPPPGFRILAGAGAAVVATTISYPLDVIRLRLNVQPELTGIADAAKSILREAGPTTFYKGYLPTILSLTPFTAINFSTFDTLKTTIYPDPTMKTNPFIILGLGASAGIFAQTICYPLDTVRRRMQMKGQIYPSTLGAFRAIFAKEGFIGFYHGMLPNVIKVVPNNAIRFFAYETFRRWFNVERKKR